jgi:hypothetical protein
VDVEESCHSKSPRNGKISPKAEAPYIERSDDPAGAFFSARAIFHLQSAQTEVKRFTVNRFTGVKPLRQ